MQADEVQYRTDGAVATVAINRPERRNAVNHEVLGEIARRLDDAERDAAVRVVVITGTGEKAFCAGGDLGAIQGGGALALHEGRGLLVEIVRRLHRLTQPTVARVNGHALGGGLGLALACDLAIAADDVELGTPEVDIGLFPMMIMPLIFRHMPRRRALEMILTGERVPAKQAESLGLLNRAVPRKDLDAAVADLCARLARKSPAVLRLGREAYYRMSDMTFDAALDYLKCMLTINTLTEDAGEGIMAFLQKRPPEWKGM